MSIRWAVSLSLLCFGYCTISHFAKSSTSTVWIEYSYPLIGSIVDILPIGLSPYSPRVIATVGRIPERHAFHSFSSAWDSWSDARSVIIGSHIVMANRSSCRIDSNVCIFRFLLCCWVKVYRAPHTLGLVESAYSTGRYSTSSTITDAP